MTDFESSAVAEVLAIREVYVCVSVVSALGTDFLESFYAHLPKNIYMWQFLRGAQLH